MTHEFTARRMAGYGVVLYASDAAWSYFYRNDPTRAGFLTMTAASWLVCYLLIRGAQWIGARYRIVRYDAGGRDG